MSTRVGDLYADLSLRMTRFNSGLQQAVNEVQRAGSEMQNAVGPQLQQATKASGKKIQQFTWQVRGFMKDTSRVVTGILISQGFYKLLNSIEDATASLFKFNDEMQRAAISFSILLKSEQESVVFMEALRQFAEDTPFTFEQAELGARRLMAMGFAAKNVIPIMRDIADMTSVVGGGVDTLERMTRAFGQIKTKGRLMAEEIRQLNEVGVPAMQILKDELGLTQEQIENIGDYKIPADAAIMALLKGIQGNFAGAAAKMEQTTGAIVTRIGERLQFLGNEIFKGGFENVRQQLSGFADALGNALKGARAGGLEGALKAMFPAEIVGTMLTIAASIRSIWQSLKNLAQAIKPIVTAFGDALLRALAVILPVMAGLLDIITNTMRVAMNASPAIQWLVNAIAGLIVASTAALLLEKLYAAVMLLTVSGPVAKMIVLLKDAIIALSAAMMRNPWIAVATIAAAALLSIAMSSKVVSNWLDALMKRLAILGGYDYTQVFNPQDPEDMAAAIQKYQEDLAKLGIDLTGVGADAEKAGKKVKDKFVASFDEVHQIPELKDDNSFDDMLKKLAAGLGTTPTPPTGGGTGGTGTPGASDLLPKLPDHIDMPVFIWPEPPTSPPPGAVATALILSINAIIEQAKLQVATKMQELANSMYNALQPLPQRIAELLGQVSQKIQEALFPLPEQVRVPLSQVSAMPNEILSTMPDDATNIMNDLVYSAEAALSGLPVVAAQEAGETTTALQTGLAPAPQNTESIFTTIVTVIGTQLATAKKNMQRWMTDDVKDWNNWGYDVEWSIGQTMQNNYTTIDTSMQQSKRSVETNLDGINKWWETYKPIILTTVAVLAIGIVAIFAGLPASIIGVLGSLAFVVAGIFGNTKTAIAAETGQMETDVPASFGRMRAKTEEQNWGVYNDTMGIWESMGPDMVNEFTTGTASQAATMKQAGTDLQDSVALGFSDLPSKLMSIAQSAIQALKNFISGTTIQGPTIVTGGGGSGGGTGSSKTWGADIESGTPLREAVSGVSYDPSSNTVSINGKTFENGSIPGTSLDNGVTTITNPDAFKSAVGLKYGGITNKDSLYRLSEGNKREAVMPLSEPGLTPLVSSIVQGLAPLIESSVAPYIRGGQGSRQLPPLNVGILIADDSSMRTFARKMKPFLDEEDIRLYGTTIRRANA